MSESTIAVLPERIRTKINPIPDGCWEWIACLAPNGYGKVWYSGEVWWAHRLTYTLLVADIPAGLVIDHLCRHRRCVNPAHMRVCTSRENTLAPGSQAPSAIQARRTHCLQGHPLSGANLAVYRGKRHCKACHYEYVTESRRRGAR